MGFGGEWYRLVPLFFALCGETSRLRYHSLENKSVKLRGLGQSPICTNLIYTSFEVDVSFYVSPLVVSE